MPYPPIGQNGLLRRFTEDELARLQPRQVFLTRGDIIHPVAEEIKHVYFPESGMVSILTIMKSGEQIETAIVGNEGVVGSWVVLDGDNTNTQATVQVDGSAQRVPVPLFLEMYRRNAAFVSAINSYQGLILFQAQQSAGCHAIHSVEGRLCRWLLLSQDLLQSKHVPLTQEFLSHMLGVPQNLRVTGRACFAEGRSHPICPWQDRNIGP